MAGNPSKNYSIAAVILVVGTLIGGYVVYSNYWTEYNSAKLALEQANKNNASLKSSLDSVESFLSSYNDERENVSLVNLALPSKDVDMANFVSSVATLAQTSSVALTGLQVEASADRPAPIDNTIAPQSIRLTVSGTYLAFKDFLLRLEQHLRIIDINHVTIGGGSSGTGTPVLEYGIELNTYYQQ